jgi:hypothetical protein
MLITFHEVTVTSLFVTLFPHVNFETQLIFAQGTKEVGGSCRCAEKKELAGCSLGGKKEATDGNPFDEFCFVSIQNTKFTATKNIKFTATNSNDAFHSSGKESTSYA